MKYIIGIFIFVCILYLPIKKYIRYNHEINILLDEIDKFFDYINSINNKYITSLDKINIKKDYYELYEKCKLIKTNTKITYFVKFYRYLDNNIDKLNEEYIQLELKNNKKYFDKLFNYPIDEDQRRAIITDDINNLIIASAGSGKTTTMIGKIRYLVDIKKVDPKTILAISFTNSIVDSFIKKLDNKFVDCMTFHKLGNTVLKNSYSYAIAEDYYLKNVVKKFFSKDIFMNEKLLDYYVKFISLYMYVPTDISTPIGDVYDIERGLSFESLKSKYMKNLSNNKGKFVTYNSEIVKSYGELFIANYLFMNGINYEYEPSYKYHVADRMHRQYQPDFYLPDYDIYIEHFGVNKENKCPQFSKIEEAKYLENMEFKRNLHKEKGTKMLETYTWYIHDGIMFDKLDKLLQNNNVKYKRRSNGELAKIINSNFDENLNSFFDLICKFINMYKGNNFKGDVINEFIDDSLKKKNIRNYYLLKIIKAVFVSYEKSLEIDKKIDFNDMINLATKTLNSNYCIKKYDYIIIDEFQDISYSRYLLIKRIQEECGSKVIAVGDDWQSIFRFSGCDLDLFVHFDNYFPEPKICYIRNTYRNSQNLINVASKFIMKNKKGQLNKEVVSVGNQIDKPISIYYYAGDLINCSKIAIESLRNIGCNNIAILGRNNSDFEKLFESNEEKNIETKYGEGVSFSTVHKSKGLEYDGVVICNTLNRISGFPNKMVDDSIIDYVARGKNDFLFDEERRLFYVALTRTKTKVILLVNSSSQSVFIEEIENIGKDLVEKVTIEDDPILHNPNCPVCLKGKMIVKENRKNGNRFISCTNYPKCNFSCSYLNLIDEQIVCPRCGSYLIKKIGKYGDFYGCLNYPLCNQTAEIKNIEDNID